MNKKIQIHGLSNCVPDAKKKKLHNDSQGQPDAASI